MDSVSGSAMNCLFIYLCISFGLRKDLWGEKRISNEKGSHESLQIIDGMF